MNTIKNTLSFLGATYLVIEPGRYLVGNVEDLYIPCIRVVDNQKTSNEILVSLYIGIYNGLIDIVLHKRIFEIYVLNDHQLIPLLKYSGTGTSLILRGPTADSLDILGIYQSPTCKIDNNTIFVIKNVGAYVEVLNSEFSGKIKQHFIKE
jgi:diaminopimelate decarboxylase